LKEYFSLHLYTFQKHPFSGHDFFNFFKKIKNFVQNYSLFIKFNIVFVQYFVEKMHNLWFRAKPINPIAYVGNRAKNCISLLKKSALFRGGFFYIDLTFMYIDFS